MNLAQRTAAAALISVPGGVVAALLTASAVPTTASAAPACDKQQPLGNFFDGADTSLGGGSSYVDGVAAYILSLPPSFCSGANPTGNFVAVWSMITGNVLISENAGYAQSGYQLYDYSYNTVFSQDDSCDTCSYQSNFTSTEDPQGSDWKFWSQVYDNHVDEYYNDGTNTYELEAPNFTLSSNCNDEYNTWCANYYEEYNGEAGVPEDVMPGTSSDKTAFTSINTYYAGNNTWGNPVNEIMSSDIDTNDAGWSDDALTKDSGDNESHFDIWSANP